MCTRPLASGPFPLRSPPSAERSPLWCSGSPVVASSMRGVDCARHPLSSLFESAREVFLKCWFSPNFPNMTSSVSEKHLLGTQKWLPGYLNTTLSASKNAA